jgi:uncharacterized membrane protein YjjP (DUF1212 family)
MAEIPTAPPHAAQHPGATQEIPQQDERHRMPALTRDELRHVLTVALRAGQIMLENGANTARVEETVHRLGTALGAEWMDVYVTPQGIIATVVSHEEHRTRIQRITRSAVDMSRMAAVIDLSRRAEIGAVDIHAVRAELDQIAQQPRRYGVWTTTLTVAGGCACFAVLFGGGIAEFLIVLLAAGIGQYLRHSLLHRQVDRLMTTAIVAMVSSGIGLAVSTWLAFAVPVVIQPSIVLAASVVLLVPGILLVSSTADLVRGDILPGLARATSALLFVMAIGAGIWAMLLVSGAQVMIATAPQPNLVLALLAAFAGAGGFAILFDVPYRALPFAAAVGMCAVGIRNGLLLAGIPSEVAAFFAGILIGLLAEFLARWLRTPTSLYAVPGYIPLVPGVVAFRAVLEFVNADYLAGLADFVRAALLIVAIAIGLGIVQSFGRMRQKSIF